MKQFFPKKKDYPGQRRQSLWEDLKRNYGLYLLILPAVVYLFIFAYKPMYGLLIAFKNYRARDGILGSEWVGLKHFIRFVTFPNFKLIFMNTLRIGVYVLATFPLSVIFALMLNEVRSRKFQKTVQMISYMPFFLSTVVVCSIVTLFLNESRGVINTVISLLGGTKIDFMTVPEYFPSIYVWSGVWKSLGWGAIIYIAALSGVPQELVDAARVDGASRVRVIWHVQIPWIMPTIIIQLILSCGNVLNVGFDKVLLLQNPLNLSYSQVISTYVYEIGITNAQYSYSAAIGLFNTIVNVLLLLTVNKIAKKVSDISLV